MIPRFFGYILALFVRAIKLVEFIVFNNTVNGLFFQENP